MLCHRLLAAQLAGGLLRLNTTPCFNDIMGEWDKGRLEGGATAAAVLMSTHVNTWQALQLAMH